MQQFSKLINYMPALHSKGVRISLHSHVIVIQEVICLIIIWLTFWNLFGFFSVSVPRRLIYIYLANDVIQNSKKKGPEFTKDFGSVLAEAFATGYR